ncbi:MAG: flagellar hook-associated protein FlgK [Candidatus Accumulibacter necessarius]|jgi:flagellar hook-associated protein 1 FlgK|uniref:flagellar hook-associated protein FlgK n=1 Tax=Candidatus Accumulibacter necessarius TaxID=2954386 RepID=UPI002FC38DE9
MGTGIIGTGVSGLYAAQLGLQTTEHNIANANTPGYTRQRTIQESNPGLLTGAGFLGQGTHVATIERVYSRFLTEQVVGSQSSASELDSYYAQIRQIDNLLADPNAGLSPALQDFFDSVAQLAAKPSDLPSRQAMISTAEALSARYQSLGSQLAQMNDGINGEIKASVADINSYAEQIASLNQQIGLAQVASGQPANDLLDSRDQLILELNRLIRAKTTSNSDGSVNVYIGSGQQLVVGSQAVALATMSSAADPSRVVVALKSPASTQEMPEKLLKGGTLGGLLAFRSESLDRASRDLGRNAASLALTFNAQSALGQDLSGRSLLSPAGFESALFDVSAPAVIANANNPAGSPSVSATFVTLPFSGNFYTDLGNSDYRLTSDGINATLTRLSDNKQWSGATLKDVNDALLLDSQGFTLAPAGVLPAGASYLIQPTRDAARNLSVNRVLAADPGLIPAAGPIRSAAGANNTGAATISAASIGPGYPAAVAPLLPLPFIMEYQGGNLQGFPAGAQVAVDGVIVPLAPGGIVPYKSGATMTIVGSVPPSGVSFSIAGLPNNGDRFSIDLNPAAVADGRNALALGQLQIQDTMSGSKASFQEAYAQLVSEAGSKTRQLQVTSDAQQAILAQAQASRESLSGVNLDEEAANLIRYQQAYQAAAKAMQIGASLFDTILQIAAG